MLVDFMSTNRLFAVGEFTSPLGQQNNEAEWEKLSVLLAEHGPAKSVTQWKHPCENTFKSFYYPENEDGSSDEEGTLGFKIKQAIAKKRASNNINTFFEIPKKKPKVYKKQSTVSQTRSDGVAYISSGHEDGAYANHLIKIEVFDMQKIKNISPLEYWKHCDLRVKYYTVGEDDPLEQSARDVIYDITKQIASKDKCVKYFLDSDKKQ